MTALAGSALAQSHIQRLDASKRTIYASDGRKYVITDSGINVATEQAPPAALFWLNKDEVVFVARKGWNRKPVGDEPPLNYQVSVWNLSLATIQVLQDFGADRPSICLNDGYLRLNVRSEDRRFRVFHGKVGQLREDDPNKSYSHVFCRPTDELPAAPAWGKGRSIIWLQRVGDGFVDFGDQQKILENTPLRLYKNSDQQEGGIQLPLKRRDVAPRFPYYEFARAYFVNSRFFLTPPPRDFPYPVYWLYPDGRVEKIIDIPWGPWRSAASSWPLPTKRGIVFISHNFNVRDERDLAHAGMYFFDDRTSKLLKAWIGTASTSPDGCKVAFSHANVPTRKNNVLQVIDVCTEAG